MDAQFDGQPFGRPRVRPRRHRRSHDPSSRVYGLTVSPWDSDKIVLGLPFDGFLDQFIEHTLHECKKCGDMILKTIPEHNPAKCEKSLIRRVLES